MLELSDHEVRVLGVLLEKQRTTPDDYPLTTNSVMRACNQSTSRDPIVRYEVGEVEAALRSLRERNLTRVVHSPSNRAAKHRHVLDEVLRFEEAGQAVLCLLMLRGPQTVGELKTRSPRLHPFADLAEVQATLEDLAARDEPLVAVSGRRPGHKEVRWFHLLGVGGAEPPEPAERYERPFRDQPADAGGRAGPTPDVDPGRADLEARVAELEAELQDVRAELADLRDRLDRLF
jgi:uncharacterized protein YceH (UPF0502 family)